MSMLLNPFLFGGGGVQNPFGLQGAGNVNVNVSSGQQLGFTATAIASGAVNFMNVRIHSSSTYAGTWRMVIYAASSASSWGAKLAETAVITGATFNTIVKVPLITPLLVTSGAFYGLSVHSNGNFGLRGDNTQTARWFNDAFGDGAIATAPALNQFAGAPIIFASGS